MTTAPRQRPQRTHIFIIDGTMSRLDDGDETNAGLLYKLLSELGPRSDQSVGYHPGVQASGLRKWINVAAGTGINQSIRAGYAALCSRYEPGDKIMLMGFSRGAYAVRSLAGFISRIGLLRRNDATERRIERAFRYYEADRMTRSAKEFCLAFCHTDVPIEFLGVWDTVKALGLPYPILNRLAPMATEFHDHGLSPNTRHAYQALALDENRTSYEPLPWRIGAGFQGVVEQMWFAGAHSDIGGHVGVRPAARTLANLPLVWMLERAVGCGMVLPDNWRAEFPLNPVAPMLGPYKGSARFFVARRPREVGLCSSEAIHPSVYVRMSKRKRYAPRALISLPAHQTELERRERERIPKAPPKRPEPAQ